MLLKASDSVVACAAKSRIPLAPERLRACYPVSAFLPSDAPRYRTRGGSEDELSAAWSSFVSGEPDKSMLGAWARNYFKSQDEMAATKATFVLGQCAHTPGRGIDLDLALVKEAAGDWAP